MLKSRALQLCKEYFEAETVRAFDKKKFGKFTTDLDKALPQQHMMVIYKTLNREETNILVQLRTNHTCLNAALERCKVVRSAECACGKTRETIKHFLF
jgi:hypothetical protein